MRIKSIIAVICVLFLCSVLCAQESDPGADTPGGEIDLDQAVVIAVAKSPALAASTYGVDIAKFELNKVKKATNPTVSASTGYTRQGPGSAMMADQKGTVSGTVSMPIDITGSFKKAIKAQTASYDATRFAFETSLCALIYNVKASFFNVLSKQDQLAVAESSLAVSKANLEKVQNEVEVGTKPKFDLTRQEYDVVSREGAVTASRDAYAQALNSFNNLLGVTGSAVYIPKRSDDYFNTSLQGIDPEKDDLINIALVSRPEVKQANRLVEGQDLYIDVVKGKYLPSFSVSGSYNKQLLETDINGKYSWNAMANLAIPIFSGGIAKDEVASAEAAKAQADSSRLGIMQSVSTEVMNALLALNTSRDQINTCQKAVDLAREAQEIAQLRYDEQLGTFLDVQTAMDNTFSAENNLIAAKYAYIINIYNLEKALGRQREIDSLVSELWEEE
ncbi:MAG: TolC family protein [Abditibacteriota bacterium]|nr:TolC family protein [Abditibacteriota bacterium]